MRVAQRKLRLLSPGNRILLMVACLAPLALVLVLVIDFMIGPPDPSARYFPSTKLQANHAVTADLSLVRATGPVANHAVPTGPVPRPNSQLTPGVVAEMDLRKICAQPKHIKGLFDPQNPLIPPDQKQAVFNAYRIPPQRQALYGLDLLIPMQLGGAITPANIWPMPPTHTVSFHQKAVLNQRMRTLVCHGEMPLAQAQREMACDWVGLWAKYGA
jgi:hypothetical protein